MKKCKTIKKELLPYLNGELDIKMKRAVEAHLKECESCREEFEKTKLLYTTLKRAVVQEWVDADKKWMEFLQKIEKEEEEKRAPLLVKLLMPLAAAAVGLAAIGLLFAWFETHHPSHSKQTASITTTQTEQTEENVSGKELAEMLEEVELYQWLDCFKEYETIATFAQDETGIQQLEKLLDEVEGKS